MFKDRSFTFRLHAPHIISSNGKRNLDENMVEWKFPMADIINRKGSFLRELKAEIEIFNRQKIMMALISVLTIIILAFSLRKRNKK